MKIRIAFASLIIVVFAALAFACSRNDAPPPSHDGPRLGAFVPAGQATTPAVVYFDGGQPLDDAGGLLIGAVAAAPPGMRNGTILVVYSGPCSAQFFPVACPTDAISSTTCAVLGQLQVDGGIATAVHTKITAQEQGSDTIAVTKDFQGTPFYAWVASEVSPCRVDGGATDGGYVGGSTVQAWTWWSNP